MPAVKIAAYAGQENVTEPAERAAAVTPHDTTEFTYKTRALYVGGAGNVAVNMDNETGTAATVVFVGVPAGTILPIQCNRVNSTSTTATSIVALW